MVHVHKIKEVKGKFSMDRVTIGDLLLGVKVIKMWRERSSIFLCGRWHAQGQCWSERQGYGCNNCGRNHPSDECHQPDKVISMSNSVANPQQQARDNMLGARPQGGPPNELRPPNLYYDHENARQSFHPPARLQTANGYNPIQNRPGGPRQFDNMRQPPLPIRVC